MHYPRVLIDMRGLSIIAILTVPAAALASAPQLSGDTATETRIVREAVPTPLAPTMRRGMPALRPAISVAPPAPDLSPEIVMVTTTTCEAGACLSVSRRTAASSRLERASAD